MIPRAFVFISFHLESFWESHFQWVWFIQWKIILKKNPRTIVYVLSQPHIGMTHFLSLLCGSRIPFVAGQGGPRGPPLSKFHFSNNIFFLLQHFYRLVFSSFILRFNHLRFHWWILRNKITTWYLKIEDSK